MYNAPKTKSEAEKFRYGTWRGFPKGHKYDANRCCYKVFNHNNSFGEQCKRKPGYGSDGLYCKQHAKLIS